MLKRAMTMVVAAAVGLLSCSTAAAADDIEKIEKDILKKWDDVKSVAAKVKMSINMEINGSKMKVDGDGTYELLRRDDRSAFRLEMKQNMLLTPPNSADMKLESSMMTIDDGEALYTLTEQLGRKNAIKSKRQGVTASDLKRTFETLKTDYTLKVAPDAKVGEEDCHAIEATLKDPAKRPSAPGGMGVPSAKTVLYFSKKTGLMLKRAELSDKGEELQSLVMSDVKLNEKIEKDRFEFKLPEGVQLVDQSKN